MYDTFVNLGFLVQILIVFAICTPTFHYLKKIMLVGIDL